MDAQWQPEAGRNASETNDDRVHVHVVIDVATAKVFNSHGAVDQWLVLRHVAHRHGHAGVLRFKQFEAKEELGKPNHQSVVAKQKNEY